MGEETLVHAIDDEELRLIEDILSISCKIDGEKAQLSPRELLQHFDGETLLSKQSGEVDNCIVGDEWWLPGYIERQRGNIRESTIDLTQLAKRLDL